MDKDIFRKMLEKWPSEIVYRGESRKFTGGVVSPKSLANLDSQGLGPKGRFKIGAKTCYPAAEFVSWLELRARKS